MKGMRLTVRLVVAQVPHRSPPDLIEVTGRVTHVVGDHQLITNALNEIEQLVNAHLPHLRLHVSLEE